MHSKKYKKNEINNDGKKQIRMQESALRRQYAGGILGYSSLVSPLMTHSAQKGPAQAIFFESFGSREEILENEENDLTV